LFILDIENQTSCDIPLELLESITKNLSSKDIELIVCHNGYIEKLNKEFRNKNSATDVLSFPYMDMPYAPLGSIVISVDFVLNKSKEYKHSFNDEFSLLFIHGLLHLLGYDHEVDDGEHRTKEQELIKKFKLPDSLIVRNG
jgi:probable rRNA maturation factor